MKQIERGELYMVDLSPTVGSEQGGYRPAIILQNDVGNAHSPTTLICPLTTQTKRLGVTQVVLLPDECGIAQRSTALCEQIRVIDKSRLGRRIGSKVPAYKLRELEEKILVSFGIDV